jgi:hypothetical protein
VVSAADEVVTSILKCDIAPPGLQEIDLLVYIQLVLENLSLELRVVEDSNERVPELGFELIDGLLVERWIIILVEVPIRIPAGWILRISRILRVRNGLDVLLILLVSPETEPSGSSSRHG